MATPICEDGGFLQEWAPESFLTKIPSKALKGIFSNDLKLTCIDAVPEFIALGTNCGFVYWYCRKTGELQRLRLENTNSSVTCVKIVSTVDYMLAAGTDIGNVTVFEIPKKPPANVLDILGDKNRSVQRFTIDSLHKTHVTCLEWSPNGMKLFSGDKNGNVGLTTIDFQTHLSKSMDLLNEKFEVVQLSYYQNQLLISTVFRTILCNGNEQWKVSQIGSKERKTLGKFGATFCRFEHGSVIYASRPGQRLWLADTTGNVQQTLIFKTAVQAPHYKIPLLNPMSNKQISDHNFGKLLQFGENRLISYQSELLYVLHPGAITVVGSLSNARRILDVAVTEDEIFVLEGDLSLIRIGHAPNPNCFVETEMDESNKRRSFIFDDIANKIKDTAIESLKKISSEFIDIPERISPPAMGADALDLPPILNLPKNLSTPLVTDGNVEIFESIEEPSINFPAMVPPTISKPPSQPNIIQDEVIALPVRRKKSKKYNQQGPEPESDTMSTASDDRLVCGFANDPCLSEESPTLSWSQSQSSFSILKDVTSLLPSQSCAPSKYNLLEAPRTPDDKSQASISTCESVSENLPLTSEQLFKQQQDKIFYNLANADMLDSFNSEKTENMSISVNLTPSSSASSRLSDNVLTSEVSENVSMISDLEPRPESPKESLQLSNDTSSLSSGHSQKVVASKSDDEKRKWNNELILSQILGFDLNDPLNRQSKTEEKDERTEESACCSNSNSCDDETSNQKEAFTQDLPTPVVDDSEASAWNSLLPESDQILLPAAQPSASHCTESASEADSSDDSKQTVYDSLSYGPPSGSSLLSSCHPSLDLNSGPTVLSNSQALVIEKTDRWLLYKTPEDLHSMAVCQNYVVVTDNNRHVYYSPIAGLSLVWSGLDYKASEVAVSMDAKLVWVLHRKTVTALLNPSLNGPFSDEVVDVATSVRSISVGDNIAYYVHNDGKLKYQRNLSEFPCNRSEDVPCPWLVNRVVCRGKVVLALTSDDLLLYKNSAMSSFKLMETPCKTVSCMDIGPSSMVWIVTPDNEIYVSDDYDCDQSHWWQVLISEYIFQNSNSPFLSMHKKMSNLRMNMQIKETAISVNDSSIWVYNKHSSSVHVNKMDFTGYIWEDTVVLQTSIKFDLVSSNGVFEEKGHIWLLSRQGDLFSISPSRPSFLLQSVPSPSSCKIVCLAAALDTLWVLTEDGTLYARLGLTEDSRTGTSWRQLRLPQLTDRKLIYMSCGCDVAWCLDVTGRVFITLVPPHDMATSVFDAAWILVEGKPKDGAIFTKLFVGPQMYMVWALDNKKQIYVREGIFSNYQIGTGWVYVGGIEAVDISVSSTAVWALTSSGAIYRRHGISESNYIGDYWRRIPGHMKQLSATFSDDLWAVTAGSRVSRLLQRKFVNQESGAMEKRTVSLNDSDDWMVVE